jgi:hypothetical protein
LGVGGLYFRALHTRLDNLYNCGCDECKAHQTVLNLGVSDSFKQLLKDGENAFKHLHKKGGYKPEDLKIEKPYQKLIQSTFDAFDFAIKDNDMPDLMRIALQDDARLFGSLKANAQLFEASKLLLNADGRLKPFSEVSRDFDKLNVNYNQNYLEAEYEFAVASSQAAAQWANLGGRYNLQYRTAQDERVRASHQALADITLPKEDPFWNSFYPPNGWRCRCVAVEVLKGKYEESDSEKAITAGEKATTEIGKDGKNRLEIFRFNPGAQKVVFPPAHPYGKVKGAKELKKDFKTDNKISFKPDGIDKYAKTLGVKVNPEIFNFLSAETEFKTKTLKEGQRGQGAHYQPSGNYVYIPIDDRRRNSSWWSEAVVYHEFGHAADWQNGFKKSELVTGLMDKYRKEFSKNKNEGYQKISEKIITEKNKLYSSDDINKFEKLGAVSDTLMSLNKNYGSGHPPSYWKTAGHSEAEFIAHAFENKFAENEVFKEIAPELYEDMRKLIDELKPKEK